MERPFKDKRPIGPFVSSNRQTRLPSYTIHFAMETDEVLDGRKRRKLKESLENRRSENGGDLFAKIQTVEVSKSGLSAIKDIGTERKYDIRVTLTPTIQSRTDAHALNNIMLDIVEEEVNGMYGSNNVEDKWNVVCGDTA